MRQYTGSSALVVLALVACMPLGWHVLGRASAQKVSQSADDETITLQCEQVFVKFEADGPTFSLTIEPNDTLRDLYEDISGYEGVPARRMRLRLGETELRNYEAKLFDYNIRAGTTVTLVMLDEYYVETVEFTVKTLDGRELPLVTQLGQTVASLKDRIKTMAGIKQTELRLLLNGKELVNERRLAQYKINNGTKIDPGRPLEDFNREVTLYVKTMSGATIEVEANLAGTVADLKERIANRAGVPACVQHIATYQRLITGDDHLCDLGLEANSIVYMFLHTSRITSPDQVARLQVPTRRGPIFCEAKDKVVAVSVLRDVRNWMAREGPFPGWNPGRFNSVAYLEPNPDNEDWIRRCEETAKRLEREDAEILRAKIKLSSAVRPYRVAANLTGENLPGHEPGITLAGGLSDITGSKQLIPLGADIDNWAPDAFSDSDLMRLFEVCERVQQALTRAAQTGEGILSIASRNRINEAILSTYIEALAGYPRSVEYKQAAEGQECGICRDDLTAEPAVKLGCEHTFHADCILHWVTDLYREQRYPSCPFCRQRFMFAYEALGKAELGTGSELQLNQDDK